jgi:GNAT superfamily N-acetyltransferase
MIEIRQVETFDEAAMAVLAGPIFGDAARQQYLAGLIGPEAEARHKTLRAGLPKPERIRMAAFDGERFVGCSSGWFEFGGNFYIGLSAVDPAYRRQGIYSRLLRAMELAVRDRGGLLISSQHVATNSPVLIAKLKLGYVIAGTEYVEPMGLLVRLVLHLAPERRALFEQRTGTLVPPPPAG